MPINGVNNGMDLDPAARQVVNSQHDFDTTNIVEMKTARERICTTLQTCQKVLKEHSGPCSGYAMLVNSAGAGTTFEPNVFTRDGIRILNAVEFMSPLEKFIKELITYIGARVDDVAKDGTTSTMLFASAFLEATLEYHDEIAKLKLSVSQITEAAKEVFERIREKLVARTFTINKLAEVAEDVELDDELACKLASKVAYMQALSSSGGREDLAEAMREIFRKSPPTTWEFISSYGSARENGQPFQVEVDEWDGRVRCAPAQQGIMNNAIGTEFVAENVNVLVYASAVIEGSINADALCEFISKYNQPEPLVVITSGAGRLPTVVGKAEAYDRITVWEHAPEQRNGSNPWPWELMILGAKAGITPFSHVRGTDSLDPTKVQLFHCSKVHWHDTFLELHGFVQCDPDDCIHPYYRDLEHAPEFYRNMVTDIKESIKFYKEGHRPDGQLFGYYIQILNDLACIHRPTLRLGGPAHEQIANRDVVQDVQGATMSSLNHGFVVNSFFDLFAAISEVGADYMRESGIDLRDAISGVGGINHIRKDGVEMSLTYQSYLLLALSRACMTVMETQFPALFTQLNEDDPQSSGTAEVYYPVGTYINLLDGYTPHTLSEYLEKMDDPEAKGLTTTYPVMQPVTVAQELLKRIQELLMKVVNTNQIIVYGGVVLNQEEEDGSRGSE